MIAVREGMRKAKALLTNVFVPVSSALAASNRRPWNP